MIIHVLNCVLCYVYVEAVPRPVTTLILSQICAVWYKYNIVDLSFTNTIIDVDSPISADMMSAGAINDVL